MYYLSTFIYATKRFFAKYLVETLVSLHLASIFYRYLIQTYHLQLFNKIKKTELIMPEYEIIIMDYNKLKSW